jgi:polysaccharide export outer membrane protein
MSPAERHPRRRFAAITLLTLTLGPLACGAGSYVWVDDLAERDAHAAPEDVYVIASFDLLNIRVYNQDAISTRSRVGADGKIALPFVGEIMARGERPGALARELEARLRPFILSPWVSITVDESQSERISVLGEVTHPGVFPIGPGTGVLQALALAGGVTEYADRDRVFVIRPRPGNAALRIRLNYKDLTRGIGRSATFPLLAGDTVIVE